MVGGSVFLVLLRFLVRVLVAVNFYVKVAVVVFRVVLLNGGRQRFFGLGLGLAGVFLRHSLLFQRVPAAVFFRVVILPFVRLGFVILNVVGVVVRVIFVAVVNLAVVDLRLFRCGWERRGSFYLGRFDF